MSGPSVSVVVPNYNHAPYLAQRIHSILEQTLSPKEIIVLDDASTDDSLKVIAGIRDPRICLIRSERNAGNPFRQWNKGIRSATGDLVWIAESDDWADRHLLAELVPAFGRDDRVVVAACNSRIVRGTQMTLETTADWNARLDEGRWTSSFRAHGSDEVQRYVLRENTLPNASAVLFRRSSWREVGEVPEHLRFAGDWLFWGRMLRRGDLHYSAEALNHFRRHPDSATAGGVRTGRLLVERLAVVQHLMDESMIPPALRTEALRYHVDHVFWESVRSGNQASFAGILNLFLGLVRLDLRCAGWFLARSGTLARASALRRMTRE